MEMSSQHAAMVCENTIGTPPIYFTLIMPWDYVKGIARLVLLIPTMTL